MNCGLVTDIFRRALPLSAYLPDKVLQGTQQGRTRRTTLLAESLWGKMGWHTIVFLGDP